MSAKTLGILAGIAVIGGGGLLLMGGDSGGNRAAQVATDGSGVSTAVACEDIAATRGLVNTELAERKSAAADTLAEDMEVASDNYWEKRRALNDTKEQCDSEAQLADPCKDLFEQMSALADQILADIDNGFDEAKFQQREELKKDYDKCVENPPAEETTPGKLEQCLAAFNSANEAALAARVDEEATAQTKHDETVATAEREHNRKMGELDALEKECDETKYERKYGSLPGTGIPVTDYMGGSAACTGLFPGNDPELRKRIANLESQFNKADAAGKREGFGGTIQLREAIQEIEREMAAGEAKCVTDADCGGPEPVCCNVKEVGRAYCDAGICAYEKTACGTEEICAGKPSQCMALIQVIEYQGSLIPTSQLRISDGGGEDNCDERHWHGAGESLDGQFFSDPNPSGCGFGTVEEKPAFSVYPPST